MRIGISETLNMAAFLPGAQWNTFEATAEPDGNEVSVQKVEQSDKPK